jgi:hypothetical protein
MLHRKKKIALACGEIKLVFKREGIKITNTEKQSPDMLFLSSPNITCKVLSRVTREIRGK